MTTEEKNSKNNHVRKILVNAQYVKDLSFENPHAPNSLIAKGEQPKINIGVDIQVQPMDENAYEVSLIINANAKAENDDKALFMAEVSYAGVFTVDVPEFEKEPVLMVYCPGILFPYARRIISDATRDGGFPPLMLDPVDFASLYQQHKAGESNKENKESIN